MRTYALADVMAARNRRRSAVGDSELIERFQDDPDNAYAALLEQYSPIILRMIGRFMSDPDEAMEVYTSICERLRADDCKALRQFKLGSELTPWLSVVVANACRDRFRKQKATSAPQSVISKLSERDQLIFKYFYQEHIPHEDIAELVKSKHGMACTPLDVVEAVGKINEMLSVKKRWMLLAALNANRDPVSLDDLEEIGFEPTSSELADDFVNEAHYERLVKRLNEAMSQLEKEDQLLVYLRFEQNMTAVEIASVLGYESHKYTYTRLRTVINQLRRFME